MKTLIALAAAVSLAVLAGTARAAGGPIFNDAGGLHGIQTPTGYRYVTIDEKNAVLLVRIAPDLHVAAVRPLPGRYTIPAVAIDRTTSGLSADAKSLVLVQPRLNFGRAQTRFLIVSLPGMHVRSAVTLRGDFTFDAMSPDASLLYFIEYMSKTDPTRYQVRAFDTANGRLVPEPIVDRTEPDEDMRGYPLARVTSADGRWAYTLYDGGGDTPFVHVLDTVGREAHCVDLDELAGRDDLYTLRLRRESDGSVAVARAGIPILLMEKTTFRISEPRSAPVARDGSGTPWRPIVAAVAALLVLATVSFVIWRRPTTA